jgi:branched-chain amino acid transport system permease protein
VNWTLLLQLVVYGLILGSTYAAMSVSFGIIYSTSRTFNLAHSITYTVAAYVVVQAVNQLHAPLAVACLLGMIGAAIFGVGLDYLIYRPLRAHGTSTLGIFLASLAVVVAGQNLIQIIFGPGNKSIPAVNVVTISVGSIAVTNMQLISFGLSIASIAVIALFVNKSRMGHAITAVRTNTELSKAVGIPTARVLAVVFAIGSALAGLIAFFDTAVFAANPTMGLAPVMYGFIGLFLGGIDSILGASIGGFLVGFLIVLSGLVFSQNWAVILAFVVLVVVLIVRPQGLLGGRD